MGLQVMFYCSRHVCQDPIDQFSGSIPLGVKAGPALSSSNAFSVVVTIFLPHHLNISGKVKIEGERLLPPA